MKRMEIKDINTAFLTLHASLGNFRDIDVEDLTKHKMDSEQLIIPEETCKIINTTQDNKKRICAIGTTVMRALETAVCTEGHVKAFDGWTNKFIFPPYDFTVASSMVANLYFPYSQLLMMVAAFGGYDYVMNAYNVAVKEGYQFGTYGDAFAEELRPYIDALNTCHGTLHCPEAEQWAERALDEHLTHAEMSDDRAYAQMSRRAVLMGFLRGMVLYIMNGMQWSQEIDEFAAWSVRYDMWCKIHFFGDLMHQEMEAETMAVAGNNNSNNLLDLLPSEFTRQMAQDMRIAQGLKPNPKDMLAQWVHRGYIVKDEARDLYIKV
jgi:hypothetical protein